MNSLIKVAVALGLAMQCATSLGATTVPAVLVARAPTMYAVSGILRSTADTNIIKVVQGFVVARSLDEAVDVFSHEALAKYPGRSIMDTVATPLPITKPTCGLSI